MLLLWHCIYIWKIVRIVRADMRGVCNENETDRRMAVIDPERSDKGADCGKSHKGLVRSP